MFFYWGSAESDCQKVALVLPQSWQGLVEHLSSQRDLLDTAINRGLGGHHALQVSSKSSEENRRKRVKTDEDGDGQKWVKMDGNRWKWTETDGNRRKQIEMDGNGWRWTETGKNG